MTDQDLLAAARAGDEAAFGQLVGPYRSELTAHCYRMLGSIHDAEDALQDALLRAWRGLDRFEGRSSLRSWLYTIATNACLRAIERRPKRVLPIDYGPAATDPHGPLAGPLVESVWIDPYPSPDARYEQRESVELAFIAALQHLPAQQRAVLILRDVLGFSGGEVADALQTSPEAVYSALQRAHKTVEQRLPERSQQATLRALGEDGLRDVVQGYVDAWERGDVDALAARLAEDAVFAMPPEPTWFRGQEAIAAFLRATPMREGYRWRVIPTSANGQPAFAHYIYDEQEDAFVPEGVAVLTLDGAKIAELTVFRERELFERFGLPDRL
jgi:RNA polymerase sigma-70 factor (ECF subfamily)